MVDLHTHTNCSDGSLTPIQLVDLACEKGLKAFSITDHDSLDGYDGALAYADSCGIDLVCGVELSSIFHGRPIHVLGYFLHEDPGFLFRKRLSSVQKTRRERNQRLAERLRELGLSVRLSDAEELGCLQTGRPHFAQVLVNKGYVSSYREAFDRYLDESKPGYVERRDPSVENVLTWIRDGKGVSSWAHPMRFVEQEGVPAEELFSELADKGLNAVEVFHSDHTLQQREILHKAALSCDLLVTGGSDFHGEGRSRAALGSLNLPLSILENLRTVNQPGNAVSSNRGLPQNS
tara:strand:+ start:4472 stop:5344 length:873 start_codon:yes stop_codon:yes gene_type:complete